MLIQSLDYDTQELLAAVGNHEAKSLAAATVNAQPGRWFSINQLRDELVTRQGAPAEWPINSGTVADYCAQTLVPLGAVIQERFMYKGRSTLAFHATKFGMEKGLPFNGGTFEWSLEHPRHSVQKLLGITAVSGEYIRGPVFSYLIMRELVSRQDGGEVSMASVSSSLTGVASHSTAMRKHLNRLEDEELAVVRTNMQNYNPIFEIDDDKLRAIVLTSPVSLAVRTICEQSDSREMSLQQLLDAASKNHPEVPLQKVRLLMNAVVALHKLPFLKVTNRNGTPIDHSTVELTDEGKRIIGDFIEMMEASINDDDAHFRDFALKVVESPEKYGTLMDKARRTSNFANPVANKELIISVLENHGSLTISALRENLASQGYKVGTASLSRYMRQMAEEGSVHEENRPISKNMRRKARQYEIVKKSG